MFGIGKKINAAEIAQEVTEGKALLIDVRRDDEWSNGHAVGAIHLVLDRIMRGELPTKDTSTKLYLYCASGGRSSRAATYLKGKGFTVENLGGLSSWRRSGGEVEN